MDELTKQAIDALRVELAAADQRLLDHISAQKESVAASLECLNTRWAAAERAVVVAQDVANKRLDNMNEFRGSLSDQQKTFVPRIEFNDHRKQFDEMRVALSNETLRFMPRSEADTRRQSNFERFEQLRQGIENRIEAEVVPLRAKIDAANAPNWGLIISVMSVLLVMAAGLWTVIGLQITNAIEPVKLTAEQTKVALSAEIARAGQIEEISHNYAKSIADIEAMKASAADHNERIAALRAENTRQSAALIEVETQFCAADIMRNLMHAQDMRIQSMLWAKSYDNGINYPTDNAYYPVICNRPGAVTQPQATGR